MATHHPLTIPPLMKDDRIEDWRLLFEAGVRHIIEAEDGERKALQILPAYINRDIADREAVRDVSKNAPSVKEALDKLAKVLDPPVDQFASLQELGRMNWQPGMEIGEYFFSIKRKAFYAKMGMKHVASILAMQLPRDVQNKIKEKVTSINDDLEHENAHDLILQVKTELVNAGHSLTKGNRSFDAVSKVAVAEKSRKCEQTDRLDDRNNFDLEVNWTRGRYAPDNPKGRKYPPNSRYYVKKQEGCYICGKYHFWRYCPDKRCAKYVERERTYYAGL